MTAKCAIRAGRRRKRGRCASRQQVVRETATVDFIAKIAAEHPVVVGLQSKTKH